MQTMYISRKETNRAVQIGQFQQGSLSQGQERRDIQTPGLDNGEGCVPEEGHQKRGVGFYAGAGALS